MYVVNLAICNFWQLCAKQMCSKLLCFHYCYSNMKKNLDRNILKILLKLSHHILLKIVSFGIQENQIQPQTRTLLLLALCII